MDPGEPKRGGRIHAAQSRMGKARAHKRGMQRARELDVVDEFAPAGEQARILCAQDARADGFPAHRPAPKKRVLTAHLRATQFRCTSFDKLRMMIFNLPSC